MLLLITQIVIYCNTKFMESSHTTHLWGNVCPECMIPISLFSQVSNPVFIWIMYLATPFSPVTLLPYCRHMSRRVCNYTMLIQFKA